MSLGDLFQPLREHWRVVVAAALIGAFGAIGIALLEKPIYEATAQLEVQSPNEDFLNSKTVSPNTEESVLTPYLQTQVKIIESEEVLGRVVHKLNLEQFPEYRTKQSWLARWPVVARFLAPNLPGEEQVINRLRRNIAVRVPDQTQVIEISCRSRDPILARNLANTISSEFIDETVARRIRSTENTGRWLSMQLQDLKRNLQQSEEALQEYARRVGLLITPSSSDKPTTEPNIQEAKLRDVEQALARAEDERAAAQARYERIAASPPDSLPEVLDDLTLRDYYAKLTDLRRQAADLGSTLAPGHYKVKEVQAQIAVLETALNNRRDDLIARIKTQYEAARTHEKLLAEAYAAQSNVVADDAAKAVRYHLLKREVDSNRSLYEAALQRVKEAGVISAVRTANLMPVDTAHTPRFPAKPDLRLYAVSGLFAGAFAGIVLAFRRPQRAKAVGVSSDSTFASHLPQLGAIPDARRGRRTSVRFIPWHRPVLSSMAVSTIDAAGLDLACWVDSESPLAESIRSSLASVLLSSSTARGPAVLAVTSPCSGDGKTTLAANFAILLAKANRRVLLVDANLRSARLHQVFGTTNEQGFSSLLRDDNVGDALSQTGIGEQTSIPGLHLLPIGPDYASVADRLYSSRLPELFKKLREEFDAVVVDTAPLSVADTRPLARLSDGVVLVVRARQAAVEVAAAAQRLVRDGTVVLGVVINNWDVKASKFPSLRSA